MRSLPRVRALLHVASIGFCWNQDDVADDMVPVARFDEDLGIEFPVPLPLSIGLVPPGE